MFWVTPSSDLITVACSPEQHRQSGIPKTHNVLLSHLSVVGSPGSSLSSLSSLSLGVDHLFPHNNYCIVLYVSETIVSIYLSPKIKLYFYFPPNI
ncbi:hypothetical protein YC2023_077657 [Brassica napus]